MSGLCQQSLTFKLGVITGSLTQGQQMITVPTSVAPRAHQVTKPGAEPWKCVNSRAQLSYHPWLSDTPFTSYCQLLGDTGSEYCPWPSSTADAWCKHQKIEKVEDRWGEKADSDTQDKNRREHSERASPPTVLRHWFFSLRHHSRTFLRIFKKFVLVEGM